MDKPKIGPCTTCEFMLNVPTNIVGRSEMRCRRHPPTLVALPIQLPNGQVSITLQAHFPPVSPDIQCGDYDPITN